MTPSLKEVPAISSSERLITANAQTASHDTIDGASSNFPSSREKHVAGAAKSPFALALKEANVLSLLDELDGSSSEESFAASPETVPHNTTEDFPQSTSSRWPNILIRHPPNCYQTFYITRDLGGYFWTYPCVGGPFQSISEADTAIESFLYELRHGTRCNDQDKFSRDDCKYYLDGPPMRDPNLPSGKTIYDEKRYLIEALLDQYNSDHNLSENRAHELEDLLRKQLIYEDLRWYFHFNFTTKQIEADGSTSNKLFFAEVSHMQGEKFWEVRCCCMIETGVNGGHCYGCRNNGCPLMVHPVDTREYTGGHLDGYLPFCVFSSSDGEDEMDEYESKDYGEESNDYGDLSDLSEVTLRRTTLEELIEHILDEM